MTEVEIKKTCKDSGLFNGATTLCAFSNGSIFVNGNLIELKAQAANEGSEFYLFKGEMPEEPATESTPKNKKNDTKD